MTIGTRLAAAAFAAAAALAGAAAPALAQSAFSPLDRRYTFEVSSNILGGLPLAKGEARFSQTGARYAFTLDVDTKIALTGIDRRDNLSTEGRIEAERRLPQRFERSTEQKRGTNRVSVRFGEPGAPPVVEISRDETLPPSPPRGPVNPDLVVLGVDPLTFLLEIVDEVAVTRGETCDALHYVWDGERLIQVETRTLDVVKGARVDCKIIFRSIEGLPYERRVQVREETTSRVLRVRNTSRGWEPEWFKIQADFGVFKAEFLTTLERVSG